MVPLQKRSFLKNTRKASKWLSTPGGHIGPPLQRHEKPLNRDVGEHRCVLPHNNSRDAFLSIIAKIWFLQCNHKNEHGRFFKVEEFGDPHQIKGGLL